MKFQEQQTSLSPNFTASQYTALAGGDERVAPLTDGRTEDQVLVLSLLRSQKT